MLTVSTGVKPMGERVTMWCQRCGRPVTEMIGSVPPGGTAENKPCGHRAGVTDRPWGLNPPPRPSVLETTAWQFTEAVSMLREALLYLTDIAPGLCREIDDGLPAMQAALKALAAEVGGESSDA
jgi:hypothetical protein